MSELNSQQLNSQQNELQQQLHQLDAGGKQLEKIKAIIVKAKNSAKNILGKIRNSLRINKKKSSSKRKSSKKSPKRKSSSKKSRKSSSKKSRR